MVSVQLSTESNEGWRVCEKQRERKYTWKTCTFTKSTMKFKF